MGSLKKFDGSSWVNSNLRKLTTDTDTFTTFPAIIYAEGTNATIGLKGNTVQSSTPTPDSPVMPQGTGERTGNLFDKNSNTINNTGASRPGVDVPAGTYSINNGTGRSVYYRDGYNGTTMQINAGRSVENISANDRLYVWRDNNVRQDGVMLNEGSTALPYEPYGYKIPISSANTTTPVYLGEVETTRRIRKLVLTGEESWNKSSTYQGSFYAAILDNAMLTRVLCTHAEYVSPISVQTYVYGKCGVDGGASTKNINLFIGESSWTVDDIKAYIAQQYAAGTPVTVWYVLATPETAVVNEPLMKIGDYADTVSSISIPITAGGDTLSVGTTVQPSEVTANYYGWHTITVHERESGQWD